MRKPSEIPGRNLLITTSAIPPSDDCVVIGLVAGTAVVSRNVVSDTGASIKNLTGGELKTYTTLLDNTFALARDRLVQRASELGADGVFGIQVACPQITSGAAEVLLVGTAFKRAKANGRLK